MLTKTPVDILNEQIPDERPERQPPAAPGRVALGFAIALVLWALLTWASVKYGIPLPDVMT